MSLEAMKVELIRFTPWNRRIILSVFALLGVPISMLDIGSGIGSMVKVARALGARAVGVDLLAEPPDLAHDLTKPLTLSQRYELVTCIEVAEHLPESAAETLCDTIANHAEELVVFSAAVPGQGGIDHINLKHWGYWDGLLRARGLVLEAGLTNSLSVVLRQTAGPAVAYLPRNVKVLRCAQ